MLTFDYKIKLYNLFHILFIKQIIFIFQIGKKQNVSKLEFYRLDRKICDLTNYETTLAIF